MTYDCNDTIDLMEAVSALEDALRSHEGDQEMMVFEESMDLIQALGECVAPAAMFIDASKFSGNGSTYACLVPAAGETLRLLDLVLGTRPPFDPDTLREEAHVTLVYSREQQVDLDRLRRNYMVYYSLKPVVATVEGVEYWEGHDKDGYAVFKLYSEGAVQSTASTTTRRI